MLPTEKKIVGNYSWDSDEKKNILKFRLGKYMKYNGKKLEDFPRKKGFYPRKLFLEPKMFALRYGPYLQTNTKRNDEFMSSYGKTEIPNNTCFAKCSHCNSFEDGM